MGGCHTLCFDLLGSKNLAAKESYISLSSDKMNSSFSIAWNKYLEGVCHSLYKCVPELADSQSTWGLKNEKVLGGGGRPSADAPMLLPSEISFYVKGQ